MPSLARNRRSIVIAATAAALLSTDQGGVNAIPISKSRKLKWAGGGGSAPASSVGFATSSVGRKLLSRATRLAQKYDEQSSMRKRRFLDEEEEDEEESGEDEEDASADDGEDISYLAAYSLKFQGCSSVAQWNDNYDSRDEDGEDEEEDEEGDGNANAGGESGKVVTKNLVRLRLCPSEYCVDDYRDGCKGHYGEYVVDLSTYVEAWMEWVQQQQGQGQGQQDDEQDEEGQDEDDEDEDKEEEQEDEEEQAYFDPEQYSQCTEYGGYYVGPYCTDDGNHVGLGVFTDQDCTVPVSSDEQDFHDLTESALESYVPYSGSGSGGGVPLIPTSACVRCQDPSYGNDNGNDQVVDEMCEQIHDYSAKCETLMSGLDNPNEYGCDYIATLKDIQAAAAGGGSNDKLLTVLIAVFAVSTVLLAMFALRLKRRLNRATVRLNSNHGRGGSRRVAV